ncbi:MULTISPECIES: extracellular solute-binding protein [Paenibacillus]|uniref:extracellular solute-binding protein n=1 Tax=Paenibacillus TaxID=44249 RepID=UPI000694B797|nr:MULTISPECIES: extracellular solute-binding protein [Paenibacillus]OMC92064.1 ABC transporter substrate-binding protein [Paenibacillus odorifer]OME26389.1 ABC transporter substrate-binding protein [Paenibacillus odorifer]
MQTKGKIGYVIAGFGFIAVAAGVLAVSLTDNDARTVLSQAESQRSIAAVEAYMTNKSGDSNYYNVLKQWTKDQVATPILPESIPMKLVKGGQIYSSSRSEGYGGDVLYAAPKDVLTYEVEVQDEGLYEIWLDDYILEQSTLNPELQVEINGKKQYNEMNELKLAIDWKTQNTEHKVDRYGDELTPKSVVSASWRNEGLSDPNFFYTEPMKFHLNKGKNLISFTLKEGYVLIGKAWLNNTASPELSYKEYAAAHGAEKPVSEPVVTIEAEDIAVKSRQSIRAKYVRNSSITPYSYKHRLLNVLDGYSFGESGDKVSYPLEVKESGFYHLTFKYSQDTNNGMPTHRRIEIDGEVPFSELKSYSFDYSSGWTNATLQDEQGVPYEIYLEKGKHILSLSIDNTRIRDIYHELLKTAEMIDSTSQSVNRLTGGLIDKERKWNIQKYIPEISTYLEGISAKLEEQKLALIEETGNRDLPALSQLEVAKQLVEEFIGDSNELPHYMGKFMGDQSSAYGRIKSVLPMLVYNPMHLDKIYVGNSEELPKADSGLLTSSVENIKAFFYSFGNPRYAKAGEIDDDTVEIWVNQSRLYVEIMQRMIDEEFTPATGIKINLSILPDENKIVLSNAANSTPDAAMGVSFGKPFELAIRGIIEDLRGYDGFYKLAEEFHPGAFIPFIYDEGVYAFPETQDVKLLFYRKDILKFLGEEPPQTWEDVAGLVPMLQKYDMNFYTPLGSNNSFKGFDTTTPFLYQFGGQLYDETGSKTAINKEGAYKGFEFMTDLFTVYNVPITTSEFFQNFRNGKAPVGIGDANTYIQLKYAAPDLAGQWGVLPIPGVRNDAGVIERWDPTYGSSSIIFKNSDKKKSAWEFIRWWESANVQSEFSYNIKSTLGEKFLYMTANLKGFADSAWPSDSKDAIMQQWEWIQATGKVPGDYVVEREISNAWNAVVFSKQNPRTALDNAVKTINRELERKLKEFGYIADGKLVKPYKVPTIDNVENWVRENGK